MFWNATVHKVRCIYHLPTLLAIITRPRPWRAYVRFECEYPHSSTPVCLWLAPPCYGCPIITDYCDAHSAFVFSFTVEYSHWHFFRLPLVKENIHYPRTHQPGSKPDYPLGLMPSTKLCANTQQLKNKFEDAIHAQNLATWIQTVETSKDFCEQNCKVEDQEQVSGIVLQDTYSWVRPSTKLSAIRFGSN